MSPQKVLRKDGENEGRVKTGGKSRAQFPEISVVYPPSHPHAPPAEFQSFALYVSKSGPDTRPLSQKRRRKEDSYIGQQEGAERRGRTEKSALCLDPAEPTS